MKFFFSTLLLLSSTFAFSGTSMKQEGSCTGNLKNGTTVSFVYYSNFDGCKNTASAAVSFNDGREGLYTGTRKLASQDVYSFTVKEKTKTKELIRLTFKNSTGNTEGTYRYIDQEDRKIKSTTVSCQIRDYEYSDC